jgi:Spy/CpxP family protein refolding chaperone
MIRRSIVSFLFAATACVTLAGPAFAQGTPTPPDKGGKSKGQAAKPFKAIEDQLKALDLSAEQQEKVTAVLKHHEPEARKLSGEIQKARKANDEKALADGREQSKALRSKVLGEIQPILTPEQQKQLKHAKKKH